MAVIYETENFIVKTYTTPEVPHNDRLDGGHIIISPKIEVESRQDLTPAQLVEFIWLSSIVGEAMTKVLTEKELK